MRSHSCPLYTPCDSPIGTIWLTSDGAALTGLSLGQHKYGPESADGWIRDDDARPFAEAKRQIAAYFAGELTVFALPLAPQGTAFQKRVWDELTRIPYGVTCSYGEVARRIGSPNAARAVGLANGRNPISIIVPCHRVIGASGKLTGYSGGIHRKETLLALEGSVKASKNALSGEDRVRRLLHSEEWPLPKSAREP